MKRKTLFASFVFTVIVMCTFVGMNKFQNGKSLVYSDLTMSNIEALAAGENAKDCPGGYCSRTNSVGEFCEACCPADKDPVCDTFGCKCSR